MNAKLCPQCGGPLETVTYPANSMLNREQFDACRAGDYYCTVCKSNEAKTGHKYWFERDLKFAEKWIDGLKRHEANCKNQQITGKDMHIAALEAALREAKRVVDHQATGIATSEKWAIDVQAAVDDVLSGGTSALDAMLREARAKGADYAAESFAASGCNGAAETLRQMAAAIRRGEVE